MKNTLGLAILAVVLAFVIVQGVSLVRSPPAAAVLKEETTTEPDVRSEGTRSSSRSASENFLMIMLGPLVIATACYLLARRRT